ncbi:MAG: tetratricopeptide repeat protein [Leptolyngbya sp. SIO3F4]|nr:tetratricopeptide repeat protein [Leptolyngbya sp. SIO3F4]
MALNAQLILDQKPTRQQQKLKTLTKYVQTYPSGWKKRLELAKLLYAMGRWYQAIDELSQVLERQPQAIEACLLLGHLWQLTGKEKDAILLYGKTLTWVQDDATRYHILGLISQCQGCPHTTLRSFEQAILQDLSNSSRWLILGQVQLTLEMPWAAQRSFDVLLYLKPDDVTALLYSYDALLQLGQFKLAKQRLDKALMLAPNDFRVLLQSASRRCQQRLVSGKDGRTTLKLIRTALQLAPQSAEAHHVLACYHVYKGESTQGKAVLEQFIEHHPDNPHGWYYYAQVLFLLGNIQKAADAIMRCYQGPRCDREIYRALCEILPAAGRLVLLRSILREMLAAFPLSWSLWTTAGRVLVEQFDNHTQGIAHSARAIELAPEQAAAWFAHGRVLMLAGHYDLAVEALEQGWSLGDDGERSVSAAVWLGESYGALEQKASWQKWLQRAVQLSEDAEGDCAISHYWHGRALYGLGEMARASKVYQQALTHHLPYSLATDYPANSAIAQLHVKSSVV